MYNIMKVEENSLLYIKNQQCSQGAVFTHTIWMPCSKTVVAVCVHIPTVHWILACSIDNKRLFQCGSMRCVYTLPKYHNIPCRKMTLCIWIQYHPIYPSLGNNHVKLKFPSSKHPSLRPERLVVKVLYTESAPRALTKWRTTVLTMEPKVYRTHKCHIKM